MALTAHVPRLLADWWGSAPESATRVVDGTLVSADISGFTALSERLATLGRQGAEALTDVVNECFEAMIACCDEEDGDVLKFGGDALLVLFEGADHAARACRATVGMRASIRRPVSAASAGRVQLRMSVGVHSGTFPLYLVDSGHRELFVTGPAATETVACEGAASAGQILLSAATASLVDPRWLGPALAGGRLLRRVSGVAAGAPAPPPNVDLTALVPSAQRDQILAGAAGEHRNVAIAFLKLSHTDATEPAVLARQLHDIATMVADAVARHGIHWLATDVAPDGAKIILAAGAPTSMGDDEDRLLRAVREILDASGDIDLRAGLNGGAVFVGALGARSRRTFTVMGDAVNLAARMMQAAGPGQLLATRALLDRASARFEIEDLEPFLVKGKAKPILAAVVGAPVAVAHQRRDDVAFVGRVDELATLHGLAAAAINGRGGVVDLVGDAGIGKSRLVDELARELDIVTLAASCQPYDASTPYAVSSALLRSAAGIGLEAGPVAAGAALQVWLATVAPDVEPLAPLLALAFAAAVDDNATTAGIAPRFRRARMHDAVAQLARVALSVPALVRIEDVQWIDPASGDLLGHLAGALDELPWLLVLTRSPGPTPFTLPPDHMSIAVGPIDHDDARAMARAVDGIDDDAADAIATRAAGHPLFIAELAAAVADGSSDTVPDSIERLLTTRLDTLDAADRVLLRDASVLGLRFDLDLAGAALGGAAGVPARWEHLGQFVDRTDDVVAFRHGLVQRVAYEGLAYRRRRDVHRSAAQAIELRAAPNPEDEAELLSLHYHHALDAAASWHYSTAAAAQARTKFANEEAAELLERALSASARLPNLAPAEIAVAAETLGDVCELSGRFERAAEAYADARALLSAPEHQARLLRKSGVLRERAGRYSDALRWYSRGLRVIAQVGGGASEEADLALAYAGVRYRQGRARESAAWASRALGRAIVALDRRAEAHAYYLLDVSGSGDGLTRADYGWRAVEIFEDLGDHLGLANALNNLGIAAYFAGRWTESLDLYERSAEARRRCGDVVGSATQDNNIAEILSDQGRHEAAAALFRRARKVYETANYPMGLALVTLNEGRLASRSGRHDDAAALLADAHDRFRALGAGAYVIEIQLYQAEALLLAGRDAAAAAAVADVEAAWARTPGDALAATVLHRLQGWVLLRAGDRAGAAIEASDAIMRAQDIESALEEALALRLRAGAGGDTAKADRARAAELLDGLGVLAVVEPVLA